MAQICIGIHAYEQPTQLHATLDSLQRNTAALTQIMLLPDGPDAEMRQGLQALDDACLFGTSEPLGAAACFNRLAANTDAPILVLLESGALVGPGWLDHLLAALDIDPLNGLAGPSTNRAWNEQCVFRGAQGDPRAIAATALEASRRFGRAWRTLEPLFSLADFCYAVRREVITTIGVADEGYGLGPCWEMDYNVRAARAGWRGVWACGAYVYRLPSAPRRQREEALRFDASKHRYQDKFCGLRLRGQRQNYEPHCRGEVCEHFAPRDLIQPHISLQMSDASSKFVVGQPSPNLLDAPPHQPAVIPSPHVADQAEPCTGGLAASPARNLQPLVSCIMPTRGRPDYVLQSVQYFLRQDYAHRELIIVDDAPSDLAGRLPNEPAIRCLMMPPGASIGAKRNLGCREARGSIIAQWDDDDWYGPCRLSAQVAPLLAGQADITGLEAGAFFDLDHWTFWRCKPELHRRMFFGDVHGGTLVFWQHIWAKLGQYPNLSLAEDAFFLRNAQRRGARLCKLANDGQFIYLRHGSNAWSFACGQYLDPEGWLRVAEPPLSTGDRAFYVRHSPAAPGANGGSANAVEERAEVRREPAFAQPAERRVPLVSCIMPTADRRMYVAQAVRYFLRQDYAEKELIIADDGGDPVADLAPEDARIRYLRLERGRSLGAKRNLACAEAHGEFIAHWDDDDWMAPNRLSVQVAGLQASGAMVCGLARLLFYEPATRRAWLYAYPGQRAWVAGGTMCYTRAAWEAHPFPEVTVGEDARFVWAQPGSRVLVLPEHTFYVAMVHNGNTDPKRTSGAWWHPTPCSVVDDLLGADLAFYM